MNTFNKFSRGILAAIGLSVTLSLGACSSASGGTSSITEMPDELSPVASITGLYVGSTEEGTTISSGDFEVTATYEDGNERKIADFTIDPDGTTLVNGETVTFTLTSEEKTCTVDVTGTQKVTMEMQNALKKAQSYSDLMHMSKQGIYDQLTSEYGEGFDADAAQYAVDNVDADWNENALEKAKSYQETMSMSRNSIYDQLVSEYGEQFTAEEAQYAIDNLPE